MPTPAIYKKPVLTLPEIVSIGKGVAKTYLETKQPMTELIYLKVLGEDYTTDQIIRICEQANLHAFKTLREGSGIDKSFEYPLAMADTVIRMLNKPEDINIEKKASKYDRGINVMDVLFGKEPEMAKAASDERVPLGALQYWAARQQEIVKLAEERLDEAEAAKGETVRDIFDIVRDALLDDTSLDEIYTVLKQALPDSAIPEDIIQKLLPILKKRGLVPLTTEGAEEISDIVPVDDNPLVGKVSELQGNIAEELDATKSLDEEKARQTMLDDQLLKRQVAEADQPA